MRGHVLRRRGAVQHRAPALDAVRERRHTRRCARRWARRAVALGVGPEILLRRIGKADRECRATARDTAVVLVDEPAILRCLTSYRVVLVEQLGAKIEVRLSSFRARVCRVLDAGRTTHPWHVVEVGAARTHGDHARAGARHGLADRTTCAGLENAHEAGTTSNAGAPDVRTRRGAARASSAGGAQTAGSRARPAVRRAAAGRPIETASADVRRRHAARPATSRSAPSTRPRSP
jgi:hypothetical protein